MIGPLAFAALTWGAVLLVLAVFGYIVYTFVADSPVGGERT